MGFFYEIMNNLKRILVNSSKDKYFREAWELYSSAFPIDERRELKVQEQILGHEDFNFEIILDENGFVGFLTWWKFKNLIYIEHFATLGIYRGKGYGKKILQGFLSERSESIILEVELPHTEIDKRRIGFYERLDFKLNLHKYQQLPYRKNGAKVDLLIMSYPSSIDEVTVSNFKKAFKEKCYDDFIL